MASRLSRREVLAGAIGIPAIIPSGVIGRRGRPGANDRIVIASIGVGGMGRNHVPPDVAMICDVDDNRAADMAKAVLAAGKRTIASPPELVRDYRRVLERKDIDAITSGTPDHWHAMIAVHACEAGKHVYSEKPTCRTLAEGRAMVNAARKYNRVVQIGAQGRSNVNARAACQYVRGGQLGKVTRVDILHPDNPTTKEVPGPYPVPTYLDWEQWVGPARYRPYHPRYHPANFRWFMDLGGGQIRDRGNHAISIAYWLMNNDDYRGTITCTATGQPQTSGMYDVPLKFAVTWEFKDWTLSWTQTDQVPKSHGLWGATYRGDKDSLIVIQGDNACETEAKAKAYQPTSEVFLQPSPPDMAATDRHRLNWMECIKSGKRPAMDVEIGYKTCTCCILANISYLLGRKVVWDVAKERFANDTEADAMITAPYRAGWSL